MKCTKPLKLKVGDTVAIVSPSWGGPNIFPAVYELGIKRLEQMGLKVREFPTARKDNYFLYKNPKARAEDVNNAFADTEVKAIIASIGGEDSVRILPYLNKETIRRNPKIIMGYSDTTTLLTYINQLGLVTFHGPSVMAGFGEQGKLFDEFTNHIKTFLFEDNTSYEYKPYSGWTEQVLDWGDVENLKKYREYNKNTGWKFIQGATVVDGKLFGGCIEVFEFMKGTEFWPSADFWNDKIIFFETSEEKPPIDHVKWMLRNYGTQNILNKIKGILFGRARDYSEKEKIKLEEMIIKVVREEFNQSNIPIVTNMDFGHTDPQFILPLGIRAQIDCNNKSFRLLESPLS